MTWVLPVNEILRDEITKIDYTLFPPGFIGDVRTIRLMQESLSMLIDDLGDQSARAQGLSRVITTAEKVRNSPGNTLYLLKDVYANGGAGLVIGYLKVGHKKLFLYDLRAQVIETEPLCVLDFYVRPEYQRHGYGKRLFEHMLQEAGASPTQLAIDGPSDKMRTFMRKNFGLAELVQQSNNFAVALEFFQRDQQQPRVKSPRSTPVLSPQVGRFSAHRPPSTIGNVIHGGGDGGGASGALGAGGGGSHYRSTNGSAGVELPTPEAEGEPQHEQRAELLQDPAPPVSRPSTLHIDTSPALCPQPATTRSPRSPKPAPALSPRSPRSSRSPTPAAGAGAGTGASRDTQLTGQGYFDMKFHHNKLW